MKKLRFLGFFLMVLPLGLMVAALFNRKGFFFSEDFFFLTVLMVVGLAIIFFTAPPSPEYRDYPPRNR